MNWRYWVDEWAHRLHLPRFILYRVCDWFDERLEADR